jgi:hypothetical protein
MKVVRKLELSKLVDKLKERLNDENLDFDANDVYWMLRSERLFQAGRKNWYSEYTKSNCQPWFDVREPHEGNEPRRLWENGFSKTAKSFKNMQELKDYFYPTKITPYDILWVKEMLAKAEKEVLA